MDKVAWIKKESCEWEAIVKFGTDGLWHYYPIYICQLTSSHLIFKPEKNWKLYRTLTKNFSSKERELFSTTNWRWGTIAWSTLWINFLLMKPPWTTLEISESIAQPRRQTEMVIVDLLPCGLFVNGARIWRPFIIIEKSGGNKNSTSSI